MGYVKDIFLAMEMVALLETSPLLSYEGQFEKRDDSVQGTDNQLHIACPFLWRHQSCPPSLHLPASSRVSNWVRSQSNLRWFMIAFPIWKSSNLFLKMLPNITLK